MNKKEYNSVNNPIVVKCRAADTLPIDRILEFQGDLKTLSKINRTKLFNSICQEGFIAPMFLWDDQGEWRLLDGHGRLKTLLWMREQGWDIPMLPVDYIDAVDEADARRKLLKITSQYGEFDMGELEAWLEEAGDDIENSIRLVDEELSLSFGESEIEDQADDTYTDKIKAPIYEITGENPEISELIDKSKAEELIEEIIEADIDDEDLRKFLIDSANRHIVFTYNKIAEYYAHASSSIQSLMEKSALVIIDFDKAIENGFVKLNDDMTESYKRSSGILEEEDETQY